MAKNMKITDLSRDFSMKSKDVCDAFREIGFEKNSGGAVSDAEFESFMNHITSKHQISDIDAYIDGKISIRTKNAAPKAEPKPAPKAEAKPEAKAEAKPAAAPAQKTEPKPEAKPAPTIAPTIKKAVFKFFTK